MLYLFPAALASAEPVQKSLNPVVPQSPVTYENATITEDVSWRGSVVVRGAVVVAPQATLRIEPGTEIRFMAATGSSQRPSLVVMGRIQAVGSPGEPILFASAAASMQKKGAWGGILLLSSEKRNQLEHCRIEGAEAAIEGRFSSVSLISVAISSSTTGVVLRDSTVGMSKSSVSGCDTGIEVHDSELELRDTVIDRNRRGAILFRSSVTMSVVSVTDNSLLGILAEEGRTRLTSCEVSGNGVGAYFKGGEGQLFMSRFNRNSVTGLHLAAARLKINRCRIIENLRDGLQVEDDRATIWGNAFGGNGGYDLFNAGPDNISAPLNWWDSGDEAAVKGRLSAVTRNGRSGIVNVFPWLLEKPLLLP
jgi:hypothetical protein